MRPMRWAMRICSSSVSWVARRAWLGVGWYMGMWACSWWQTKKQQQQQKKNKWNNSSFPPVIGSGQTEKQSSLLIWTFLIGQSVGMTSNQFVYSGKLHLAGLLKRPQTWTHGIHSTSPPLFLTFRLFFKLRFVLLVSETCLSWRSQQSLTWYGGGGSRSRSVPSPKLALSDWDSWSREMSSDVGDLRQLPIIFVYNKQIFRVLWLSCSRLANVSFLFVI